MKSSLQESHGGRMPRVFKYLILLVLLSIAGMAAFHFFIAKPMGKIGSPIEKLSSALGAVTNEKVNVDGYSITLESSETRELIVVKRRIQTVTKLESKWLNSKKVFIVKGNFEVKAGFDLSEFEGFELVGNKAVGEWPKARLLGVNLLDYETFFSSSGTVNRISEKDRELAVNMLHQQARIDSIKNGGILEEAERIIRTRLKDLTDGEVDFSDVPK